MHELTNKNVANTQWAHLHIYAEKKTQMNGGQAIQNKFRFYKTKNKYDMTKQQQNKDKRKQRNKQKSLWFWQILTKLSLLVIQPIKFSLCLYISHRTSCVIQKVVQSWMWCDVECCGVWVV